MHDRKPPDRPFHIARLRVFGHSAKMRALGRTLVVVCAIAIPLQCSATDLFRTKRGVVPGNAASRPKGNYWSTIDRILLYYCPLLYVVISGTLFKIEYLRTDVRFFFFLHFQTPFDGPSAVPTTIASLGLRHRAVKIPQTVNVDVCAPIRRIRSTTIA